MIKTAIKRSRHFFKTVAANVEDCPFKKHRRDMSGDRKHREDHHGHGHHGEHGSRGEHGGRGERRSREHGCHSGRRPRSSWLETFASYMNEFANLAGDIDVSERPKAPEAEAQATATNEGGQAQATATSTSGTTREQPETNATNTSNNPPNSPFTPRPPNMEEIQQLIGSFLGGTFNINDFLVKTQMPASTEAASGSNGSKTAEENANASANASTSANGLGDDDVEMNTKASEAESTTAKTDASYTSACSERDASPDKAEDWTVINKEKGKFR